LLWNTFKYALAFGLLAYVVYANWAPSGGGGLKDVCERHFVKGQPIHRYFLLAGFVIYLASVLITLVRWYVLVRAQDLPFTIAGAMRIGLVGFFFNTFLPGSVGGDIIKAAALAREQSRRTVAVATVIMDRVIALWGLIWFVALLGGVFWGCGWLDGSAEGPAKQIVLFAAGIVGVSVVVWLLLGLLPQHRADIFAGRLSRIPKVGGSAAEFWRAVWMYRCRQASVGLALVLSWISHVGFVVAFYCCTRTLWDQLPRNPIPTLAQHFLIVPIGLVIGAIPLFPGGAGIGEAGFGGLYLLFGCKPANGVLGSLVQRVVSWVIGVLGYLVYLSMRTSSQPGAVKPSSPLVEKELAWRQPHPQGVTTP
jgi:uncharacterized membrane protein YbhN (UPF0104 family)